MSALSDAVTNLNSKIDELSTSIGTEIQQLKDAIANGEDTAAAVTALEASAQKLSDLKVSLDADDPAAPAG